MSEPDGEALPLLRVVRGQPTEEELAAVVAVLTARQEVPRPTRVRSSWADPARQVRRPLAHGHDGWRLTQRPR